jgi:hypothetical protein
MNSGMAAQELARGFNEDEAVWRLYEQKREWRRLLPPRLPLPEHILDYLDRQEAEREGREARAVGFFQP